MDPRTDREEKTDLVFGRNAVEEILKSEMGVNVLYLDAATDEKTASYFGALAREKAAPLKRVPRNKLDQLSQGKRHQGFAAEIASIAYLDLEDLLEIAQKRGEEPMLLLADGIADPHNLGAMLRTAEAVGAHGLVLPKRGGALIGTAVYRASAGAAGHVPVARVSNLAAAIRTLKEKGIFCYAADSEGQDAFQTDLTGPLALVIGSEGFGVSRLLLDLSDVRISLPMAGKLSSLNASVAAGVLLYEIYRQRLARQG